MPEETVNTSTYTIRIDIVEKKMKAMMEIIAPESEAGAEITVQEVIDKLNNEGILFGVNKELIAEIIENKRWREKFAGAEGEYPRTGEDAKLEYYFRTDRSCRPQITEDGHIDYHELSIINSVQKDAVLIKKIPAQAGIKGVDLFGAELLPLSGKDINISIGPGVYRDPNDSTLIKALADGIIFYDEQKNYIEVQKLYVVKESVDYSTGNINVKCAVDIKGDVKPGFSVKTTSNIEIGGSVEQALVQCEGTLKVKKGIVGDSKQLISAGNDIHACYINNQILKCGGSLFVGSEIRNSIINCGGEITMVKNTGVILGGKLFVSKKITAPFIGNKYNVPTEIEIGIVLEHKEKHDAKKAEIIAVQKIISNMNKNIAQLSEQANDKIAERRLITLHSECDAYILQWENLKKEIKEIEKDYFNVENPCLCVTRTVFPGTIIHIKGAAYEVKEEISSMKFSLGEEEEVVLTKIK